MVQRTISAARSLDARSAPGRAAIWGGIAAMPFWASPRPAPGTQWRSGTISAAGSTSPVTLSFHPWRNSSVAADSLPETSGRPRVLPVLRASHGMGAHASVAAENRLDIVTIRIEHKRGVVIRPSQPGRPAFDAACVESGGVECIDLSPTFGCKGGMLFDGVWVVSIDPEDGIVETVADAVGPHFVG